MAKTVTLRLDDDTYRVLAEAARADGRSLANLIERVAVLKVQEDLFADDAEMAEIMARGALLERLQEGSADARARRGRFVE
jgi:uncharacterized protein (DUF1778 family)